jgi:hypothetical protein
VKHEGETALGLYWANDYSVQCYAGGHLALVLLVGLPCLLLLLALPAWLLMTRLGATMEEPSLSPAMQGSWWTSACSRAYASVASTLLDAGHSKSEVVPARPSPHKSPEHPPGSDQGLDLHLQAPDQAASRTTMPSSDSAVSRPLARAMAEAGSLLMAGAPSLQAQEVQAGDCAAGAARLAVQQPYQADSSRLSMTVRSGPEAVRSVPSAISAAGCLLLGLPITDRTEHVPASAVHSPAEHLALLLALASATAVASQAGVLVLALLAFIVATLWSVAGMAGHSAGLPRARIAISGCAASLQLLLLFSAMLDVSGQLSAPAALYALLLLLVVLVPLLGLVLVLVDGVAALNLT